MTTAEYSQGGAAKRSASASCEQEPGTRLYYDQETYTHQEKLKLCSRAEKRFKAACPGVSVRMAVQSPERSSSRAAFHRRAAWQCHLCGHAWLHSVDALHVDCPECLSRQPRRSELTEEERREAVRAVAEQRRESARHSKDEAAERSRARAQQRGGKALLRQESLPPCDVWKAPPQASLMRLASAPCVTEVKHRLGGLMC